MSKKEKMTMLDYINSCPDYIRKNLSERNKLTAPLVKEYVEGNYTSIWIIACGSSSNGSLCARQFLRKHLKCEVKIVTPFQFAVSEHDYTDKDLLVIVSQSGYSLNALQAADIIRKSGRRVIGLTGDLNSDLAKSCDVIADYGVGRETVAYVTRGVTTLAFFFMLFAVEAAEQKGIKTAEEADHLRKQLLLCADLNKQAICASHSFLTSHYQGLSGMSNAYVCGVGANLGTASEGALKFGETISVPTAAYEIEEYIHGPNIQMTPNYTVFLIDGGAGSDRIKQIFEATKTVTRNAYLITNDASFDSDNVFCIPCNVPEEMTPLCFLPFFQVTSCVLTDDLNRWRKHPLQRKMETECSAKSENYTNSPFSEDTPGR